MGNADLRRRGLWYGWDQHSLGAGPSLGAVSLKYLQQRVAAEKIVQPQLACAHARLSVQVLGILHHALGEHPVEPDTRRRRTRF